MLRRWIENSLEISRERRVEVYRLVSDGSNPRPTFFVFVALSALIAAFGLIMDNTAVVIGAMLVAPLMTPILGIALGLIQGNPKLLRHAVRAEAAGVVIAIVVSMLMGVAIPFFQSTNEMLSRTAPNLLDLMVAVFAGLAGAYAMVDEKVSPALPGVAVSTAIVPPLANVGLCLSLGAYVGAWGSLLLFVTNFLCILLVSGVVFYLSGMARVGGESTRLTLARRFVLGLVTFVVVGIFLGDELGDIMASRRLKRDVRNVLADELSSYRISNLRQLNCDLEGDNVRVLAHVHAPSVLMPRQVRAIEARLEDELDRTFSLILRTTITQNVSAGNTINQSLVETLNGFSFAAKPSEETERLQIAEQTIREYLNDKLGQRLVGLESFPWGDTTALFAEVRGPRDIRQSEVAQLEELIRIRLETQKIRLAVVQQDTHILDSDGEIHIEFQMRRPPTSEEQKKIDAITTVAEDSLKKDGYTPVNSTISFLDEVYYGLFEVAGPPYTPAQLRVLQKEIREAVGIPVEIYVRLQPVAVIAESGYTTWDKLLDHFGKIVRTEYETETQKLIRNWR